DGRVAVLLDPPTVQLRRGLGGAELLAAGDAQGEGGDRPDHERQAEEHERRPAGQHREDQRERADDRRAYERGRGPGADRRRLGGGARSSHAGVPTGSGKAAGTGTCSSTPSTTPAPVAFCSHSSGCTVTRWSSAGWARSLMSSGTMYPRPRISARARAAVMRARVPRGGAPTSACGWRRVALTSSTA